MTIVKHLSSLSDTADVAAKLAGVLNKGDLLLFTGAIGAGKTTFIQAMCKCLGVTESVTSPTFVLHTLYETGRVRVSHVDLYRLENDAQVDSIGYEDYMDDAVTAIEWADRYSGFRPPCLRLHFDYGAREDARTMTLTPEGGDWAARLSAL